jgi:hypothetical protein
VGFERILRFGGFWGGQFDPGTAPSTFSATLKDSDCSLALVL